jgi:hypothetical protein
MDATSRGFGLSNYPQQQPSTFCIHDMTKSQCQLYLNNGKVCDMIVWMNRPIQLINLKFEEFYKTWHYVTQEPKDNVEHYTCTYPNVSKPRYLVKWVKNSEHLVRISMIYPEAGDIFYLRMILKNRAVSSWNDCLKVNGIGHTSYQEAARAAGYLIDEIEAFQCFQEAMTTQNKKPSTLRGLFVILTVDGYPSLSILSNEEAINALTEDYTYREPGLSPKDAYKKFLLDVQKRLKAHDKTLEDYSLHINPITKEIVDLDTPTELEQHKDMINIAAAQAQLDKLNTDCPNNVLQDEFWTYVTVRSENVYNCIYILWNLFVRTKIQ